MVVNGVRSHCKDVHETRTGAFRGGVEYEDECTCGSRESVAVAVVVWPCLVEKKEVLSQK